MSDKTEPTMLYRKTKADGARASEKKPIYYYKVFMLSEVESKLKDGWFSTPTECFKKKETPKKVK